MTGKKLLAGAVAATMLALQVPATTFAATNEALYAAVRGGIGYLADNQNDDGSIAGFGGETDWSIIAVEAAGEDAAALENGSGVSAVDFIKNEVPSDGTDVARKVLAIASTGGDSASFGGTNYNTALASYFNNGQFDVETLLNDDMFAIMAISKAGDPALYALAQDSLDFLLANQGADGGFSYTTEVCDFFCGTDSNDTAAAIIAMKAAAAMGLTHDDLETAQADALAYLLSTQQPDGGFAYDAFAGVSDGSSTAWSLMALNAVGPSVEAQAAAARDWLLANQNDDGGFSYGAFGITNSDTFTTAHAVIALLGTTWLLDPAPLQIPEPAEEKPTPVPVVVVTSSDNNPQPANKPDPVVTNTDQVLAVETATDTTDDAPAEETAGDVEEITPISESKDSAVKYIVYAVIALSLIGFGWYLFQPKKS